MKSRRVFLKQTAITAVGIITGYQVTNSRNRLPISDSYYFNKVNDKLIPIKSIPNLYVWTDVCNVYILRDGKHALLIDLGNGSVLPRLSELGIEQIDWILFTHHHREQCQGYPLLSSWNTQIAVPGVEKNLFEQPSAFRKSDPSNNDTYSILGASYVRPPVQSIPVDHEFSGMDTFTWRGYRFLCVDTRGNSPGSMSYLIENDGKWIAFSGDVILDGAKMHNFFDSQWDYGFGSGIRALHNSAAFLRDYSPALLLPAHGPAILQPVTQLEVYLKKLRHVERLLLRGYDVSTYQAASQDKVSKPSAIPYLWQISPHLFKFKGPNYFPNFTLILSGNGNALLVDCGLVNTAFLARTLESMKTEFGLKKIDALIITHIHGDHFLEIPYLRQDWETSVWALDSMVPVLEQPERYDLPAMIRGYNTNLDSIHVDRVFKPGETFQWEEFDFTIDWMPGQTKYSLCMHGLIDGKKVAFTGDNIFGNPDNPEHTGNEALVARNSTILEEGYIYAAEYLTQLKPDLLIGGHSFVMDNPAKMISRYRKWAYEMRKSFQSVSYEADYRFWFDPYWVRADPYRTRIKNGDTADIDIVIRNFHDYESTYKIKINTPSGIMAKSNYLEKKIDGYSQAAFPVMITASAEATVGIAFVTFDVTLDGRQYGEWFDAIIEIAM